jgi:hypothetical protein
MIFMVKKAQMRDARAILAGDKKAGGFFLRADEMKDGKMTITEEELRQRAAEWIMAEEDEL